MSSTIGLGFDALASVAKLMLSPEGQQLLLKILGDHQIDQTKLDAATASLKDAPDPKVKE